MNSKMILWCLFLAAAAFSQSITLISPNGGETFSAGQGVRVQWTTSNLDTTVSMEYSLDNGVNWTIARQGGGADTGVFMWYVPSLKQPANKVLFRIRADYANHVPADVSDSSFVILAATNDAYEPNNNFSSAYSIPLGDSVVKNAAIFGWDSTETDSSLFDVDFYKFHLDSGRLATIKLIPWDSSGFRGQPHFALYDSSKNLVYYDYIHGSWEWPSELIGYCAAKSGTYYLKVYNNTVYFKGISGGNVQEKYGLSVHDRAGGSVVITSPIGNETFSVGQTVPIRWKADSALNKFSVWYSCNNGKSWRTIGWSQFQGDSFSWLVPPLKNTTNRVLIRVLAENIANPLVDVSEGIFTILKSTPDAYEPNNDFASAFPITAGDSAVKNALIGEIDTMDGDTMISGVDTLLSGTDADFYKVTLAAKKITTIYARWAGFPGNGMPEVYIRLYDSLKNQVSRSAMFSWNVQRPGTYYCVVSAYAGAWAKYNLSIRQSDGTISLISPNGGEQFGAGQEVQVRWTADSLIDRVYLSYSVNNGKAWNFMYSEGPDSGHYIWTVPAVRQRTDKALFRINAASSDTMLYDVSDGTFTIQAAASDAYEPNNDFSSAYPVAVGDSVVKNATIFGCADTTYNDDDYYKVTLPAGKLVTISMKPQVFATHEFVGTYRPIMDLFNSSFNKVDAAHFSILNHYTTQSGIYYFHTAFPPLDAQFSGFWTKYVMSIHSATVLSTQQCILDTAAMQQMADTANGAYRLQVNADTTKLNMTLFLDYKVDEIVRTIILAPDELPNAPNTKVKVKALSVLNSRGESWYLRAADITVPYALSDLKGYPENRLGAFELNDTTNQWVPISSSLDTVKRCITVRGKHYGTYGIFVKSNTAIGASMALLATANGIKANFLPQKQGIAVHLSLLKASQVELWLYDILGKCVKKSVFKAHQGFSTMMFNAGSLGNGKYFLTVKAGTYTAKEPILIMK